MPMSHSLLSYADVREVMDMALRSAKGIRISCETLGDAYNLRQRCYSYRLMDRVENSKTYDDDHPLHNRSEYDKIIIIPEGDGEGKYYLRLEVSSPERLAGRVEE